MAQGNKWVGEPRSGKRRGVYSVTSWYMKSEMESWITLEGLQLFNKTKLSPERRKGEGRMNREKVGSWKLRWARGFQIVRDGW